MPRAALCLWCIVAAVLNALPMLSGAHAAAPADAVAGRSGSEADDSQAGVSNAGESKADNAQAGDSKPVSFNRDVRPILSDNCFQCHGPDKEARKADLRLDIRREALRVLRSQGNKPGELERRITSTDPFTKMPPPESKRSLSKTDIDILKRWLQQGAEYETHWAFQPVRDVPVPDVKNGDRPRNAVDRFILKRLHEEGFSPSPEADRETLIRRLSFDLTGLPPTLKEIDAFLADDSPNAYEKLVDRLLAKEAYGERMTAFWLDVARYSDSYGYQVDRNRFVWPWRDWVIGAFNRNMPYDDFLMWQLAGDLLPDATAEQILATTFNRLHPQKVEGGSVPEEFRTEYVADRTHTFATAFLGLTLECARCHDHKFDPISQREYYQLFAFFNNIDEAGLYSFFTSAVPTPTLWLADDAAKQRIADARKHIAAAETKLTAIRNSRRAAFRKWLAARPDNAEIPGRVGALDFEKGAIGGNTRVPGYKGQSVRLTGDDEVHLQDVGNFRRYEPFSISLWMKAPQRFSRAVVYHRSRAWTDAGSRGYELLIDDGRLCAALVHFSPGNEIRVRTRRRIPTDQWLHVTVTYDGSSRADGLHIHINGEPADLDIVRDKLRKNITGGGHDHISLGARFRDAGFTRGLIDEFQVYSRKLTPLEIAQLHDGRSLSAALSTPVGQLTQKQRDNLYRYYLPRFDGQYREQLAALQKFRKQRSKIVDKVPEIMVMREMADRRPTHLLKRGAYDKPGERIIPKTPAVFPPFPKEAPRNRLGLARWLTDPRHPLTARVAVNHLWGIVFGRGLVRTPEDFGHQGKPPTHPALLDWLAGDFVKHDWNVKRLLKMLVMSATYRQSSNVQARRSHPSGSRGTPPARLQRDPENRLLARGPSYRLPAEMLRDNALAVSGLLVEKIGGPPAKPYELAASFKPLKPETGEGLYRRSVYTYWKRTAPAPVMMTLDASKRDVCRVRRERTSSPLQALVMFNGPQFVEAARMLAQRLMQRHGDDENRILTDMFRLLTSRRPTQKEMQLLKELYDAERAAFAKHPKKAAALLKTGASKRAPHLPTARLAAFTLVANTLLNHDNCVRKQ